MQTNSTESKPWGKLTSVTVKLSDVSLIQDSYTLGRIPTNNIQLSDVRLSGIHCKIYKDADNNCWIEDLSTNGTFIGDDKLGKGKKKKLESGDKIYLLHSSKVDEILGYIFSSPPEDCNNLNFEKED